MGQRGPIPMSQQGYNLADGKLLRLATGPAILVASTLIIIKAYAYYATGSVSMLSSLTDSMLDGMASVINLLAIRFALMPPDQNHRFGHGKAEALSSLFQSALITISVIYLVYESIGKLLSPEAVTATDVGVSVMLVSVVMTLGLVTFQGWVHRRTKSLAIKADAAHYRMDLLVNLAVIAALLIDSYFQSMYADPIIALMISGYIAQEVWEIASNAIDQLMDREMAEEDRLKIFSIATGHAQVDDIHDLRTRMSGNWTFIQFHMSLDPNMTLKEAHDIADDVEDRILKAFPDAEIFIHQDPQGLAEEHDALAHQIT